METDSTDRFRRTPAFRMIAAVLVLLNTWYDYSRPLGIVLDVVGATVLLIGGLNKSMAA